MKFSSVTIDDHLLDDSGSINGNNPEITEDDLDKMYMNEGNEDSYTTQVSSIAYHVSTWGENERYSFADDLYDYLINSEGTIEPIIDHFGNTITTIEVKHD